MRSPSGRGHCDSFTGPIHNRGLGLCTASSPWMRNLAGWQMFLGHPITGVGVGQFAVSFGIRHLGSGHHAWMQPRNPCLQVICKLLLSGFICFLNFLWQTWKETREGLRAKSASGLEINYQFSVACTVMFIGNLFIRAVGHTLHRTYWYLLTGLVTYNMQVLSFEKNSLSATSLMSRQVMPLCLITRLVSERPPIDSVSECATLIRRRGPGCPI